MELGERIKQSRQKARLSQEKVAELIGVSRQAVTKWESGQSTPTTENLFRLAEILGTTVDSLIAPEDKTASIAEQVYRMFREEEMRKEAERKNQVRRNVRTCLSVLGAYLSIYIVGKLLCWKPSEMPLFPWLIDPNSTQHSYLFGWLLKSGLFHYAMLFSSLIALTGLRRLSLATLAGFALALPLGEFLGGLDCLVAPGYHFGWAIWGGIYLSSCFMGFRLQKIDPISLRSGKFQRWLLWFAVVIAAVSGFILLAIPLHARA